MKKSPMVTIPCDWGSGFCTGSNATRAAHELPSCTGLGAGFAWTRLGNSSLGFSLDDLEDLDLNLRSSSSSSLPLSARTAKPPKRTDLGALVVACCCCFFSTCSRVLAARSLSLEHCSSNRFLLLRAGQQLGVWPIS